MGKKVNKNAENEFHVTILAIGNQVASMGYARKTMTNPAELAMWMAVRGAEDFLGAHDCENNKVQNKDVRDFLVAVAAGLLNYACLSDDGSMLTLGKLADEWRSEMNCWENDPVKREKAKAEIKAEREKKEKEKKPCCVGLYSKDCPSPEKCPSLEECKEKEAKGTDAKADDHAGHGGPPIGF